MSTSDITQLEQYLFSENKEEFINRLISGTDSYYYFSLITAMNNYGLNLSKENLSTFEKYKKFKTPRCKNIKLRYYFLELSNPQKTDTEKKALLKKINKNTLNLNFDFDEPKAITSTTIMASKQEISNKLDSNLLDWKKQMETAYNNASILNSLDYKILTYLDINKLASVGNYNVIDLFLKKAGLAEFDGIENLIMSFNNLEKTKNTHFQFLDTNLFKKMTLEQMKKLQVLLPNLQTNINFVGELFIKEFEIDNEDKGQFLGTPEEKIERKNRLMKMFEWSKNLPYKFNSFSQQLLFEILQLGIETNHYNFDLFVEYLKNPKQKYSKANSKQQTIFQNNKLNYENYWHNVHNCNTSNWLPDDKLIDIYLQAYFKMNKKITPFDEYLNKDHLNRVFNKVKLYEGEQIPNITEILGLNDLKAIQEEKMISICKFNKEFFTNKEEIKLYVEIKNIPNMTIKIFELSTEDYYLKRKSEITGNINVDGLIASEELYLEFKESPQRKIIKEFRFENITKKKQGIFIIEFIGYGLSSRALIRKGRLLLLEKSTLAGQIFTILDEDLEICEKTQRTGLWVSGRFHESNEKGQVNLPFSANSNNVQAIIVHNDFACLTNINLIQEDYDFKCSYLFKDESLIMGNKLKLLIQPRLYLNQQAVGLDIIKEQLVSIVTITETGIPSTVVLDKIKFDYKQELEIEIPIPAKLKTIQLKVSGKIKKMISDYI